MYRMLTLSFSVLPFFIILTIKMKADNIQTQTQNENSFMRPVFYFSFLSNHAKCFVKRSPLTQKLVFQKCFGRDHSQD